MASSNGRSLMTHDALPPFCNGFRQLDITASWSGECGGDIDGDAISGSGARR